MKDYETTAGWQAGNELINQGGQSDAVTNWDRRTTHEQNTAKDKPSGEVRSILTETVINAVNKSMNEEAKRAETIKGGAYDAGLHYRKTYKGINLDPFRIASIYNLDGVQLTILKKTLVTGKRGNKDTIQDYKDIINAASRAIEMINEDVQ